MGCELCDRRYHFSCGYIRGGAFVQTATGAISFCWDCKLLVHGNDKPLFNTNIENPNAHDSDGDDSDNGAGAVGGNRIERNGGNDDINGANSCGDAGNRSAARIDEVVATASNPMEKNGGQNAGNMAEAVAIEGAIVGNYPAIRNHDVAATNNPVEENGGQNVGNVVERDFVKIEHDNKPPALAIIKEELNLGDPAAAKEGFEIKPDPNFLPKIEQVAEPPALAIIKKEELNDGDLAEGGVVGIKDELAADAIDGTVKMEEPGLFDDLLAQAIRFAGIADAEAVNPTVNPIAGDLHVTMAGAMRNDVIVQRNIDGINGAAAAAIEISDDEEDVQVTCEYYIYRA